MEEQKIGDMEKLIVAIRNLQKCLECPICLNTLSVPVKARCGHSYCRRCIGNIIDKQAGCCPMCKTPLRRRSIRSSTVLEANIDKFYKLINAIQLDSGIDILSYTSRRHQSWERSSDKSDHSRSTMQNDRISKPRSSGINSNKRLRRQSDEATVANDQTERSTKPRGSRKCFEGIGMNSETKNLSHEGLSGIRALSPDDLPEQTESHSKVTTWLNTVRTESVDSNTDDVMVTSVSRNETNLPVEEPESHRKGPTSLARSKNVNAEKQLQDSMRRRSTTRGSRIENNTGGKSKQGVIQTYLETKTNDSTTKLKYVNVHKRIHEKEQKQLAASISHDMPPNVGEGTIEICLPENIKELESSDVQRTLCTDMLPRTKSNWSSVTRVGKEMRTKRRKMKPLNVSIEKTNKSKLSDESANEETIKSKLMKNREQRIVDCKKGTEFNTSESVVNTRADERRFEENERLPNIAGSRTSLQDAIKYFDAGNSSRIESNGSPPEGCRSEEDLSFITLDQGEKVNIRSLNSHQMNDIIGLTNVGENLGTLDDRNGSSGSQGIERNALPSEKHGRPCHPSSRDRSKNSPQVTPNKNTMVYIDSVNVSDSSPVLDNTLPMESENTRDIFETIPSPKIQSPTRSETPRHGKLSLKKKQNSGGNASNESRDTSEMLRLSAVKRDLKEEINGSREKPPDTMDIPVIAMEVTNSLQKNVKKIDTNVRPFSRLSRNSPTKKKTNNNEPSRCVVHFQKLGRVIKSRREPIKFYYLGSTRRSRLENVMNILINREKPANPIATRAEPTASENSFGNNRLVTVNDTASLARDKFQRINNSPSAHSDNAAQTKSITGRENVSRIGKTLSIGSAEREPPLNEATFANRIDKQKDGIYEKDTAGSATATDQSDDTPDVLLVSLYEHTGHEDFRRRNASQKSRPIESNKHCVKKSSASQKANNIKMLSPEKDSQLKFLSTVSPFSDGMQISKFIHRRETTKDTSTKRSNLSDIRGEHSRALIRKSQQAALENSESDTSRTSNRKRKRPNTAGDHDSMDDDQSSSERNLSPNLFSTKKPKAHDTQIAVSCAEDNAAKNSKFQTNKNRCTVSSSNNAVDMETVELNSDIEILDGETEVTPKKSRKLYKRLVIHSGSDTDSTEWGFTYTQKRTNKKAFGDEDTAKTAGSQTAKRMSLGLENDKDVNAVHEMLKDGSTSLSRIVLDMGTSSRDRKTDNLFKSDKSSKLNSVNVFAGNTSSAADIFDTNTVDARDYQSFVKTNKRSQESLDKNSPKFNVLIDRIREYRKPGNDSVAGEKKPSGGNTNAKELSLMHDNFDDVIANVDTQALTCLYPRSEEMFKTGEYSTARKSVEQKETSNKSGSSLKIRSITNVNYPIFVRSNNSDQINNGKNPRIDSKYSNQKDVEEDDEITILRCDGPNVGDISSKKCITKYGTLQKTKPSEFGKKNVAGVKDDNLPRRSSVYEDYTSATNDAEKQDYKDAAQKDTMYEQDSLMNVTQHHLLIKQFEEDLFGKSANVPSTSHKRENESSELYTPRRKRNLYPRNQETKDAEYSGGEDDIVENTPDTKTKTNASSVQPNVSVARRNLAASQSTSFSKGMDKQSTTSSPFAARNNAGTSTSKKIEYTLYHSTPKSHRKKNPNTSMKSTASRMSERQSNTNVLVNSKNSARRKLCLVWSNLLAKEVENVKKFAAMFDCKCLTQFAQEVTHVIVRTKDEHNGANKTLKYLQGIAHAKWVVAYKWIVDCCNEKVLLNEKPYEVVDLSSLEPGPRRSRLREKPLFENFVFLCIGPYESISIDQFKDLLLATGGTVVDSVQELVAEKKKLRAVVHAEDTYTCQIMEWCRKGAAPIVYEWVVECISRYTLISVFNYLKDVTTEHIRQLGYPEFLLEEEFDSDSVDNNTPE